MVHITCNLCVFYLTLCALIKQYLSSFWHQVNGDFSPYVIHVRVGHFVICNAQADKVNTTHLIFVGRTHLGFFFLWLCYHSSAWWLVSCTSWGQVPIWFWSTFYIDIDIVYPCCCKSQCWDVYSSQNIGGVWRGQFFGFVKLLLL